MARVYRTVRRVDGGLARMATVFRDYVKQRGNALLEDRRAAVTALRAEETKKKPSPSDGELVAKLLELQVSHCYQLRVVASTCD